jgi:hypothetical protein
MGWLLQRGVDWMITMHSQHDKRRVALIKSLNTKNRFYSLVDPERGLRNADTVENIPDDLLLGIAYPCLEDGLNDFAVIRTTFETLDLFPEDDPIREEMMDIVNDARRNLLRRLNELRDKIHSNHAHFLGTDYNEFKGMALSMVNQGYYRRNLDSMMKLNVFGSVAEAEGYEDSNDLRYHYQFCTGTNMNQVCELAAREFIVSLFNDVLASVLDDSNYKSKYLFDRNVFQKFIAVMFVNYATTDPMFYGINRSDYGVSGDKDMDSTPLYVAIRRELLEIEERLRGEGHSPAGTVETEPGFFMPETSGPLSAEQLASHLPTELVNEEVLLGPIHSLCEIAGILLRKNDADTQRFARVILCDAAKLIDELKRLGIVSPLVNNPGTCD